MDVIIRGLRMILDSCVGSRGFWMRIRMSGGREKSLRGEDFN